MEINGKTFEGMGTEERFHTLYSNVETMMGRQEKMDERQEKMEAKVDRLLESPWRLAIPPVSWKAIGGFCVVMALILRGDVERAIKVAGALLGIGG